MSGARKIRIEDLREPVLTDAQRAALAYGEHTPVEPSPVAVLAAAVQRAAVREPFAFYFERFPVKMEVS
jgi:hypothetical protein